VDLSVIVITRDEEANIAECLASVGFAGEIVVVDSASTDSTAHIAQQAGAKVVSTTDWPGFGAQKNRALALATKTWVLSIDADERVTPQLQDEIVAAIEAAPSNFNAWDMPRRSVSADALCRIRAGTRIESLVCSAARAPGSRTISCTSMWW